MSSEAPSTDPVLSQLDQVPAAADESVIADGNLLASQVQGEDPASNSGYASAPGGEAPAPIVLQPEGRRSRLQVLRAAVFCAPLPLLGTVVTGRHSELAADAGRFAQAWHTFAQQPIQHLAFAAGTVSFLSTGAGAEHMQALQAHSQAQSLASAAHHQAGAQVLGKTDLLSDNTHLAHQPSHTTDGHTPGFTDVSDTKPAAADNSQTVHGVEWAQGSGPEEDLHYTPLSHGGVAVDFNMHQAEGATYVNGHLVDFAKVGDRLQDTVTANVNGKEVSMTVSMRNGVVDVPAGFAANAVSAHDVTNQISYIQGHERVILSTSVGNGHEFHTAGADQVFGRFSQSNTPPAPTVDVKEMTSVNHQPVYGVSENGGKVAVQLPTGDSATQGTNLHDFTVHAPGAINIPAADFGGMSSSHNLLNPADMNAINNVLNAEHFRILHEKGANYAIESDPNGTNWWLVGTIGVVGVAALLGAGSLRRGAKRRADTRRAAAASARASDPAASGPSVSYRRSDPASTSDPGTGRVYGGDPRSSGGYGDPL